MSFMSKQKLHRLGLLEMGGSHIKRWYLEVNLDTRLLQGEAVAEISLSDEVS